MTVIAVVDYDMGNLHSVCKGLEKAAPKITDSPTELKQADAVVLPRWGRLTQLCNICERGLVEPIKQASGKPS